MATDGIFQDIGKIVENALNTIENASLDEKFIQLQGLMGILLVLSIMYKGYQTIAGRNKDPVRDIIWDVARKMFILTFILNINGWLDLSISALKGFYEWAGGGAEFYKQLDGLVDSFLDSTNAIWEKYDGFDVILACLIVFFMLLGFIGIMFFFAFTIINASITNTFLIIALPLALLCFMYEPTKQVFTQWFNMFISNIFLLLFMSAFADFMTTNLASLYNRKMNLDSAVTIILASILTTAILISIIQVIKTMASQLAQVSLDSAAASGMGQAMGMTGRAAGFAWNQTKKGAAGATSGGALKAATRGGLAGLAGYGVKKAVKGLFGMARSKG